jgi:hypothetical protein
MLRLPLTVRMGRADQKIATQRRVRIVSKMLSRASGTSIATWIGRGENKLRMVPFGGSFVVVWASK